MDEIKSTLIKILQCKHCGEYNELRDTTPVNYNPSTKFGLMTCSNCGYKIKFKLGGKRK